MTAPTPTSRAALDRRARRLAHATVAYNTAEGLLALAAGIAAGSVALSGFGLDSAVEVLSAVTVSWQFNGRRDARERERVALRLIGASFLALACYVAVDSAFALRAGSHPADSPFGVALALTSLAVMPILARAKRRVGVELGSATVSADAAQTQLCTYLSAVLLLGLLADAALGWSFADPLAGLVIAAVAAREGWQAWRGTSCCAPAPDPMATDCCSAGCACG